MPKSVKELYKGVVLDSSQRVSSYKIGDLTIQGVPKNAEDWKVIEEDAYKPDKASFILRAFESKFGVKFKNSEQCTNLASRNVAANKFLADVNSEYSLIEKAPTYFRDLVPALEFERISINLTRIRSNDSNLSLKLRKLSDEYKAECKAAIEESEELNKPLIQGQIMKVLLLKSNQLPVTLSMAVEAYTPGKDTNLPSQKAYASELLINYKRALLVVVIKNADNPDFDLDDLINKNISK